VIPNVFTALAGTPAGQKLQEQGTMEEVSNQLCSPALIENKN
jgi:hypothetical protein